MNRPRRLSLVFGTFATLFVGSCECQRTASEAQAYAARKGPAIYATDLVELEDIRDFYKRVFGVDAYTTAWSELDKYRSGTVDSSRIPYTDSWYPERTGGTNVPAGNNSALAKYDAAFNAGQTSAVQWERANHNRPTPNWYGHCNGTGVTVTRFQNPLRNVTRPRGCTPGSAGCTEFTPADIRALLSEINMNAKAKFISGNRCRLTFAQIRSRPIERAVPQVMDECDDVNPGSFHAALVNFIGRQKQPLVFDEHQDEEVWNFPIFSYDYTAEGPWTEEQAITALRNSIRDPNNNANSAFPPMSSWIFNPRAVSFMHVNLNVGYREATFDTSGAGTKPAPRVASYEYILELDANNNVIGGEWMGPSRTYHPDFVWMPFEPAEPTGDNSRGNPFLSNTEVIKLWAESMGFNPDDPFHDKPKNTYDVRFFPLGDLAWGYVRGYYRLLLDGRSTGTAFLGKKTHLRIEVEEVLKSDATVEVTLNGQPIQGGSIQDGKLDLLFDSPPGINLLNLRWTSGRVDTAELNWDFRFYAM
jgi:hypothetical protein